MIFPKPHIKEYPAPNHEDYTFSILIPTWNNLTMLKFCIEAILKNSTYKHQIIIHVNEGIDGTLDWIKTQNLDYTYSFANAGVCYSVNAMAKLAKTDYLLYLNDDMYVCPLWDTHLLAEINTLPDNQWYLSGTMIEPKGHNKCAVTPHDFGSNPENFKEKELLSFANSLKKEDWFGASWPPSLVHKDTFNNVGGYSEAFSPGMYSDPDFSMKLWMAGVRHFKGIGKSLVYHFQSRSTGRVIKNNGRKQFAKKWQVPSSYFYKKVLRIGQPYHSSIQLKYKFGLSYLLARIKGWYISKA
jgi:GT2 family glycosyltransferase